MHWIRKGALLLVLGCVAAASGCAPDAPERPDLILITVDRLAAERLACFGGPSGAGASLCELGEEGTLFAWATTPTLSEASAAASALTGLEPREHGLDQRGLSFLAERHESVAERLLQAGYSTAAFVASPRLNRSRRLDQGFSHYVDPPPTAEEATTPASVARSIAIQRWIEEARPPYFVWIHAQSSSGLDALAGLLDRIGHVGRAPERRPGVLLVALSGEPGSALPGRGREGIGLRSHRIPLIWRPPSSAGPRAATAPTPSVAWRLASVLDVAATLRSAARIPPRDGEPEEAPGRDLSVLAHPRETIASRTGEAAASGERFLLLESLPGSGEVAIASGPHLYVRPASPLDGSGRAVPTSELPSLGPRFLTITPPGAREDGPSRMARLDPGPWRRDVLSASSPVPRLEFHLARKLAATRADERE